MDSNDPNTGDQEQLIGATNERRTGPETVQRSSIEVGSDDEEAAPAGAAVGFRNGTRDGAHPFERDPRYRLRYADNIPSGDLVFRMEDWKFESLRTVPHAVFLMLVNLGVIFVVFFLPIACLPHHPDENVCPIEPFSFLIYVHVTHWFIHLIMDQYLKSAHKKKRLQGYTEFYLETKNVRRTPFYLVSFGNAIVLTTVTILHDYCDFVGDCHANKFTNIDFLRGIITVECLTIIFMWFYYSNKVRKFNGDAHKPDFMRKDLMKEWLVDLSDVPDDEEEKYLRQNVIGMLPEMRDYVIEKHAELLRYMIAHSAKQNEKILELAMRPSASGGDDAGVARGGY